MTRIITAQHLERGMAYEDFLADVSRQIEEGRDLPPEECDPYLDYMKLNRARMKRLYRDVQLIDGFKALQRSLQLPLTWVVLVEAWCGDVAQNLPIFAKIAHNVPEIHLVLLRRDKNLDVMDRYLTNGGRAIPKLICLQSKDLKELGTWGPRPQEAQQIMEDYKTHPVGPKDDVIKRIQLWYVKDRGMTLQRELLALLSHWGVV